MRDVKGSHFIQWTLTLGWGVAPAQGDAILLGNTTRTQSRNKARPEKAWMVASLFTASTACVVWSAGARTWFTSLPYEFFVAGPEGGPWLLHP